MTSTSSRPARRRTALRSRGGDSSGGSRLPLSAIGCVLLGAAVLLLPGITDPYQLYIATLGAIYLIAASQLNILAGQVGIVSVGTSAFAMPPDDARKLASWICKSEAFSQMTGAGVRTSTVMSTEPWNVSRSGTTVRWRA